MDSRYNYDEKNETWPIFALALVSMVVVPITLGSISSKFTSSSSSSTTSSLPQLHRKLTSAHSPANVKSYRAKAQSNPVFTKKFAALLLGWVVIFGLLYQIQTTDYKPSASAFDPYDILGIDYGVSEKEIKSHFRKLSIKYHPDKLSSSTEEEKLKNEEHFVLISKAYKALTDEVVRENYEKYGHPDGPQSVVHGIALPKWLIEGSSSPFLLGSYILTIALILPLIVSSWWNRTRSLTKKGIENETAEKFVEQLLNSTPADLPTVDKILSILSNTPELNKKHTPEQIMEIFNKHFDRKPMTSAELKVISQVPLLINGFIDVASAFRHLDLTLFAIETQKLFTQALRESPYNELLQLPHVSEEAVKKTPVVRLSKLLTMKEEEMKTVLGITDDEKLKEALSVASRIPILKMIEGKFVVPGEKVVTPNSNGYFSLKVVVKSPNHHGVVPKIPESKLREEETMENLRDPYKIVEDQPTLPPTIAPFFPLEKIQNYIGLVVLQKDVKISQPPNFFTKLDLTNLEFTQEQYLKGEDLIVGTLKIQLQGPTPPEPNDYAFRIFVKSMDYFVPDIDETIILKVEKPPEVEEVDYEIPEGEDSEYESGDDDESGDEDETKDEKPKVPDDNFTDVDTDTDDEN